MNNKLVPSSGRTPSLAPQGVARGQARSVWSRARAEAAQIEARAQLQTLKVQAVGLVGQQAMKEITMLSQFEGQLAMACPLAVTRLQGIADVTALAIAQVVMATEQKLR